MTNPTPTSAGPVLIIGCGYLGRPAAALFRAAGRPVFALTRRNADALTALGLTPLVGDVLDPASLRGLPQVDTAVVAVGFDRSAGVPMRDVYVGGLRNVLDSLRPPARLIYVSSTGVYGDAGGGWVDEETPPDPVDDSGRVVRDAEGLLRSRRPDAVVLRFAGIYGPNRVLRRAALVNGEPLAGAADKWLNLVHVADGATAVVAADARADAGGTYNVADGTPVTRRDVYTLTAELLGGPAARFDGPPAGRPEPDRRVRADRIRRLGWVPAFPSYREGLVDAIG